MHLNGGFASEPKVVRNLNQASEGKILRARIIREALLSQRLAKSILHRTPRLNNVAGLCTSVSPRLPVGRFFKLLLHTENNAKLFLRWGETNQIPVAQLLGDE